MTEVLYSGALRPFVHSQLCIVQTGCNLASLGRPAPANSVFGSAHQSKCYLIVGLYLAGDWQALYACSDWCITLSPPPPPFSIPTWV